MSDFEDTETRQYTIEIEYTDEGFNIPFHFDDWMEMVREDFTSFEAVQEFWRTSPEEMEEFIEENFEKIDGDEEGEIDRDGPILHFQNPPQYWIDDPAQAMPIFRAMNLMMARMGLWVLIENEHEEEEQLLEESRFKEVLIRQSAFFEDYLTLQCQLEFQNLKEDTLTNNELKLIEKIGHKPRIRLSRLLGIIDKKEHDLLLNLADRRNYIAHNSWTDFDDEEEALFQQVAFRVHEMEEEWMDEAEKAAEEEAKEAEYWNKQSPAQKVRSDLLTIAVLSPLAQKKEPISVTRLSTVSLVVERVLKERCEELHEEGLITRVGEQTYRIAPSGEERLEELARSLE